MIIHFVVSSLAPSELVVTQPIRKTNPKSFSRQSSAVSATGMALQIQCPSRMAAGCYSRDSTIGAQPNYRKRHFLKTPIL